MHYQGYQSNNKQPAGPLILHISESYFLKFFHTVAGGFPSHTLPFSCAMHALVLASLALCAPPLSNLLQSLCYVVVDLDQKFVGYADFTHLHKDLAYAKQTLALFKAEM